MPLSIHHHTVPFNGDAFDIFSIFKDEPHVFFLDSSLRTSGPQFSYIGFSPFKIIKNTNLSGLKKGFDKYRISAKGLPFPAGAVGYLGYDGTLFFGFYDTILCLDHQKKNLIISGFSKARIKDVMTQLKTTKILMDFKPDTPNKSPDTRSSTRSFYKNHLDFQSNFTKTGYMKAVRQALEHIRRGDIYQINLSHQIQLEVPGWRGTIGAAGIYQHLRRAFPSQFSAYFDDGKQVVLSASPERFLRLQNRTVQVKPMKGTRPRGKTKVQDKKLKEQLLKSPKEIAELLMVTDLERNDLGRVCEYNSIKVKSMRTIETYASVFQATSTVEGRLCKGKGQFDLLQAAFPSGSVTGCPKIEAMKIINDLENVSRGLYTGALGYLSFSGDMDFNVMIRTIFLKHEKITFHVGGGIVADSKPGDEWQETWDKAKPLIETLERSLS